MPSNRYEYDHTGRKIATFKNINNKGDVALNHLEYNEIGQLSKKNLHNDSQATTFAYNERGWMKNSTSDQFSMELKYSDGTLPQFNGNISGQNYTNGTANTFSYSYDRLNRLTNAVAGNNLGEAISYDVMGNITSLTRDNFGTNNYTGYNGNRLTAISGFTNSNYGYDANGNLTSDSQKNITLGFNFLNLPQTVTGSQNLTYTYNAAGEKLQKQAGGTTTNYIDGIQYTNNSIDFIQTEEGLARRSANNYSYEYNLSDHLGNVRVTFYQNPTTNQLEVLQRDDYYAFGLRKEPVAKAGLNKYLYNGKELGQYDYGARFYDPVIGRWNVVDPLAEKFHSFSPFNYGLNNPMIMIDPDGRAASPIYDRDGNLLGTDDKGLQGDAIIMEKSKFEQNMSHDEALKNDLGLDGLKGGLATAAFSYNYKHLKDRPDYDGIVTDKEARAWWNSKNGGTLYVDVSKLDLTPLTTKDFDADKKLQYNFFTSSSSDVRTGRVHGTLSMRLKNANTGEVGFLETKMFFLIPTTLMEMVELFEI